MNIYLKRSYLYPFFILFSLTYFFLSTNYAFSKNLIIENIQIKENFDDKFNRNEVINKGFKEAFIQLTEKIIQSESTKVQLQIFFEDSPLLLRKIISKTGNDLITISFYDHNYNKDFEEDFFSFVPIYLD